MQENELNAAGNKSRILVVVGRAALILLETVLLAALALYGVMWVLAKGPSPTARDLFVLSVRETSAVGFLADIFLTEDEIAAIEAARYAPELTVSDDTSLTTVAAPPERGQADAWGFVDEDGDGIIIDEVTGESYRGYMMIVLDPSRVKLACVPESFGRKGYTVEEMVKRFDAVAGINAGGFEDDGGHGDGSVPLKALVFDGEMFNVGKGIGSGFVGIDQDNILRVGFSGTKSVQEAQLRCGVSFGPVLVQNGVGTDPEKLLSGINPRTAIGQRSDGAMLLLVIDGRQVLSIGATYQDEMEIMLSYGAVNACNLDGGSSSMMWYEDGYLNNCASVVGIRPVPTAFVVMKAGAEG